MCPHNCACSLVERCTASRARKRICHSFRVARDRRFYGIVSYCIHDKSCWYYKLPRILSSVGFCHTSSVTLSFSFSLVVRFCNHYARRTILAYHRVVSVHARATLACTSRLYTSTRFVSAGENGVKGRSSVYIVKLKRSNTLRYGAFFGVLYSGLPRTAIAASVVCIRRVETRQTSSTKRWCF